MTRIDDIITELKTIATAFSAVNTVLFDHNSTINDQPAKTYPIIHLSSAVNATSQRSDANNHLPREKNYDITLTFWDTFGVGENKTTTIEIKYSELELIADQYLAEVNRRTVDVFKEFYINNFNELTGTMMRNEHNDNLVGIRYELVIHSDNVGCTTGTFTY